MTTMPKIDMGNRRSSQTTNIRIENIVPDENFSLRYFDAQPAVIYQTLNKSWSEAANDVLKNNSELWQRLAEL